VFNTDTNSYRVQKFDSGASAWVLEFNPSKGVGNNQQNYEVSFDDDSRFRRALDTQNPLVMTLHLRSVDSKFR